MHHYFGEGRMGLVRIEIIKQWSVVNVNRQI